MQPSERKWLLWFAIVVLILTTLPYLIGYQRQGPDWRFSGFILGLDDGNSYIAKMLEGANGDWLFRTPYSAFPQKGFLAFLPYLLLGKLSAPVGQHDQLVALFQLFRWGSVFLLVFTVYDFVSIFLKKIQMRRLGTALIILGGGLGWLSVVGLQSLWSSRLALEFYSPESFGFLAVFGLPHLVLGRALLLAGLADYLRGNHWQQGFKPGFLWLLLGLVQPLTVVTGWVVLGMFLLVSGLGVLWQNYRKKSESWFPWIANLKRALIIGLISCPMVIYTFLSFLLDPYLKDWAQQNIILSPPPLDYLLAYAVFLVLALIGLKDLWKEYPDGTVLLLGWVLAFPFLAYAPYNLQRRLPDGVWVAFIILGLAGLASLKLFWKRVTLPLVYLSFAPALILMVGGSLTAWTPKTPVFIPQEQVAMYKFLDRTAPRGSVVLASFETSNRLPAWAPLRTITGHGPESIHAEEITPRIKSFYQQETTAAERISLLRDFNIRYIIDGPDERKIGPWNPANLPGMVLLYQDTVHDMNIFEYQPESGAGMP